jgi:hypothetical protein
VAQAAAAATGDSDADIGDGPGPEVEAVLTEAGPRATTANSTNSAVSRTTSKSVSWAPRGTSV